LSPYLAGPAADIPVGQALRVLLTATVLGRSVSFLTQIVEIATAREKLRRPVSGTRPPPPCWALHGATRCRPPPARRSRPPHPRSRRDPQPTGLNHTGDHREHRHPPV